MHKTVETTTTTTFPVRQLSGLLRKGPQASISVTRKTKVRPSLCQALNCWDVATMKQAKRKLKARNMGKGTVANLFPTPAARFWYHFLLHDCTAILKPGTGWRRGNWYSHKVKRKEYTRKNFSRESITIAAGKNN